MEILRDGLQTKINVSTLKLEIGISHCWEYRQRSCLGDFVCGSSVNRTLKQGFLADDIHKSSTHLWGENELANVLFFYGVVVLANRYRVCEGFTPSFYGHCLTNTSTLTMVDCLTSHFGF